MCYSKLVTGSVPVTAAVAMVAALLASSQPVRAEFKVGAELPEFSLKAAENGWTFSLQRKQEQVIVTADKKRLEPKALVLHLFQPDCLQCQDQDKALQTLHEKTVEKDVVVVGIAHRGDDKAVRAYAERLKLTFPLIVGTGSDLAKKFAAGDAFCITDSKGIVRYAQVGYGYGEEKLWLEAVESLLAGKPVAQKTAEREGLKVGDRLPVIELDSLVTGKRLTLKGDGGQLAFQDDTGKTIRPKAAIGMFSRY